jgi:hypothetical protein
VVIYILLGFSFVGCLAEVSSEGRRAREKAADTQTPIPASQESAASTAGMIASVPADQTAFQGVIEASRQAYDAAPNDLVRGNERPKRGQAICNTVKSPKVKEWIGTVYKLTGTDGGRGVLSIELSGDIWLSTSNNVSSDDQYFSLINPGTDLFSQISGLSEGDEVVFSGTFFPDGSGTDCFNELSLLESSSMSQPEFIFAFSDVRLNDGQATTPLSAATVAKVPASTPPPPPQPTPEEVAAKEKDKAFGLWCLSTWDGSHPEFVKAVWAQLNDPDNFEHDDTLVWTVRPNGRNQIVMAFRAKNGFGGTMRYKAAGTFDNKTCGAVEVDLIE